MISDDFRRFSLIIRLIFDCFELSSDFIEFGGFSAGGFLLFFAFPRILHWILWKNEGLTEPCLDHRSAVSICSHFSSHFSFFLNFLGCCLHRKNVEFALAGSFLCLCHFMHKKNTH